MLTIWGRISSINVQKAVWAAGEVGQPFEDLGVFGAPAPAGPSPGPERATVPTAPADLQPYLEALLPA